MLTGGLSMRDQDVGSCWRGTLLRDMHRGRASQSDESADSACKDRVPQHQSQASLLFDSEDYRLDVPVVASTSRSTASTWLAHHLPSKPLAKAAACAATLSLRDEPGMHTFHVRARCLVLMVFAVAIGEDLPVLAAAAAR